MMVKVVIDCSDVRFTEFSRSNSPALSLHSPNAATLLLLMFQHTYRTRRFICWCSWVNISTTTQPNDIIIHPFDNYWTSWKEEESFGCFVLARRSCLFGGGDGVMELPHTFLISIGMVDHAMRVGTWLVLLRSWPLLPRVRQFVRIWPRHEQLMYIIRADSHPTLGVLTFSLHDESIQSTSFSRP